MGSFTSALEVRATDDGRWELLKEFWYYTEDDEWLIVVPVGFTTDFASIPRALWSLYPPYSKTHGKAAVVHDYLYATQVDPTYDAPIKRKQADVVFLEAMKVLGAGWFKRTVMYQSVRWFAGGAWKAHSKRIAAVVVKRTVADILRERAGGDTSSPR